MLCYCWCLLHVAADSGGRHGPQAAGVQGGRQLDGTFAKLQSGMSTATAGIMLPAPVASNLPATTAVRTSSTGSNKSTLVGGQADDATGALSFFSLCAQQLTTYSGLAAGEGGMSVNDQPKGSLVAHANTLQMPAIACLILSLLS